MLANDERHIHTEVNIKNVEMFIVYICIASTIVNCVKLHVKITSQFVLKLTVQKYMPIIQYVHNICDF